MEHPLIRLKWQTHALCGTSGGYLSAFKSSTMINNSSSYSETLDRKCLKTLIERGSKARFGRGLQGWGKTCPLFFLIEWGLT